MRLTGVVEEVDGSEQSRVIAPRSSEKIGGR